MESISIHIKFNSKPQTKNGIYCEIIGLRKCYIFCKFDIKKPCECDTFRFSGFLKPHAWLLNEYGTMDIKTDETNNINLKAISVLVPANFIQGDKVLITFNLQWSEHDKLTTCCFGTCEGFRSYPFHNLYSDLWPYIKEYTNTNTNQSIQVNIKNGFINGFINDVYNGQIYLYCLVTQD